MRDEALQRLLIKDADRGMKELIDKYGGLVFSIISGKLRSDAFGTPDIEDCASETFCEFWRGFEKAPCRGNELRARLCVIAKRNATDRLRRLYSRPDTVSLDSEGAREMSAEYSLEGDFEEKQQKLALIRAVKALGRPDSEIIIRKFYLGQTSKQIAESMGMSVSNVDTRTHRAINKLKKRFGGAE